MQSGGSVSVAFEEAVFENEIYTVFIKPDFAEIGVVGSAIDFAWRSEGEAAFLACHVKGHTAVDDIFPYGIGDGRIAEAWIGERKQRREGTRGVAVRTGMEEDAGRLSLEICE